MPVPCGERWRKRFRIRQRGANTPEDGHGIFPTAAGNLAVRSTNVRDSPRQREAGLTSREWYVFRL